MSATFQDLPLEILRKIASCVQDTATLSSASMVGTHSARHAFQEELFAVIELNSFDRSHYKLDSLVQSQDIETRDRLTGHISTVYIRKIIIYAWSSRDSTLVIPAEEAITLSRLPRLTTIHLVYAAFQWDKLDVEQTRNVVTLFSLPMLTQLTDLSLREKSFPLCLLPFCPNLQVLKLRHFAADVISWVMEERDTPNLVKQLTKLHIPSTPIFLQHLELSGLDLIFYFAKFAEEYNDIQLTEVDLHYLDDLTPDALRMTPSQIVGLFIRSAGSSIETLRLHVTRRYDTKGSMILAEDFSSLSQLTSLEVTLTNPRTESQSNIAHFLETLLIPLLESPSRLKEMRRLSIQYELCIRHGNSPPDLGMLSTAWDTLDHVLAKRPALEELVCCLHIKDAVIAYLLTPHGSECWNHRATPEMPPGEDLLRHFPTLAEHGIQLYTAVSDPFHLIGNPTSD